MNTRTQRITKAVALAALAVPLTLGLGSCTAADVASSNLSNAADSFELNRRIVFFNGITDQYLLTIEGRCSINVDTEQGQLEVTCKTGPDQYKKHFLGLSDNVTYFVEQLDSAEVSEYNYRFIFKPETTIPDVDIQGSWQQ